MKNSKILTYIKKGIGTSLSLFSGFIMLYDLCSREGIVFEAGNYSKMFFGAIIVGIGFSLPCLIYEKENIPYSIRVLTHMGLGCTILIVTGYLVGWIPKGDNPWKCIMVIIMEILFSFFLWIVFSIYYKWEAKKIDDQIKRINERKNVDKMEK